MNRYHATQIADGPHEGKWHFVCSNRRTGTRPVGYCSAIRACKACQGLGGDCESCDGKGHFKIEQHFHDTSDEACACIRRYMLDEARETAFSWTSCDVAGCEEPARKGYVLGHPAEDHIALCEAHCSREQLASMVRPPGEIWASW